MIWHQASCTTEINDRNRDGGVLLCADATQFDLGSYIGQAQCIYLDPPGLGNKALDCKVRVGEKGWQTSRQGVFLPAFQPYALPGEGGYLGQLRKLLTLSHQLLKDTGSIFLHCDASTLTPARLLMDEIFGEDQFRNQIIWNYQIGGISKRFFGRRHDVILFYAKSRQHFFDLTQVPVQRKESRSNHLRRQVDEKGRSYRSITTAGKTYIYYDDEPTYPDDVWSDVSQLQQSSPQRSGYPSQKPQALLERMILSTTVSGDLVVDLCAGSGTSLLAAAENGRRFLGLDTSPLAFAISRKRLDDYRLVCQAPLSSMNALLDVSAHPGIGYYTVTLNSLTQPEGDYAGLRSQPEDLQIQGLDAIDQWHAGLLNKGVFVSYASSLRGKQSPELERSLQVPLLRGTVAVLLIDILGRRSLWTGSPAF